MILRARVILPVVEPPIRDGALLIAGNRIARVDRWKALSSRADGEEVIDFGNSIILPGLINAHCHLDYTEMAGRIPPQKSFVNWIRLMMASKAEWSYSEFAQSWLRGAHMLRRTGTTTVADMEAVPELLPEVWSATPLRVISFLELTGVKSRRDPRQILSEATDRIGSLPPGRGSVGLSPHAPYSTQPELLRLCARAAREARWPLSTHVAESSLEFDMFTRAHGEMFEWLRRNERDMSDCGLGSPVEHLERAGALGRNLLAAHVNYLSNGDARLLGRRHVSVVHCPRSHDYFGHRRFPLRELTRARVNICLGTDSLVTTRKKRNEDVELSMFEEMRSFSRAHPEVPARTVVKMATLNGARAVGMSAEIGQLSAGTRADLIVIPNGRKSPPPLHVVVQHRGDVTASMIDGQWVVSP